MRLRATSLVLAGVLIASGGALAVAQTAGPRSTAEAEATTAEATTDTSAPATSEPASESSSTDGEAETRTPPGWAKRDAAKDTARDTARDTAKDTAKDGADDGAGPSGTGPGRGRGRGPDATGPAAYGLCRAWADQEDPAAKAEHVPPFRNLAAAAGGVDKVDAYCAALPEREPDGDDDD